MRSTGSLARWNAARGFGFIALANGGEIFVHISEFPRDGRTPRIGERLWFDVAPGGDGKQRALRVARDARPPPARSRDRTGFLGSVATLAFLGTLGFGAYVVYRIAAEPRPNPVMDQPLPSAPSAVFRCDGRQHCSQMSSCEEATYFLRNCPGVMMDGDNDGIPCEKQHCGGRFGRK